MGESGAAVVARGEGGTHVIEEGRETKVGEHLKEEKGI